MYMVHSALSRKYDGIVVARLPFEAVSYIRMLSHRNLVGNDYYEMSFFFLFMVCSLGLRSNIRKLLGTEPPTVPGQGDLILNLLLLSFFIFYRRVLLDSRR